MFGRPRKPEERSPAGQPIYRHEARTTGFQGAATDDPEVRNAVEAHLTAYLGECSSVWHEIVSDLVHIDVYMWRPAPERPFFTFVTVGMSDLAMTVPEGALRDGVADRAELVLCVPESWSVPVDDYAVASWEGDAYFPIRWLKMLARLPHEYQTWLGFGHTIPNGDPPEPFTAATSLAGWVLLPPMTLPPSFHRLDLPHGRPLDFFGIIALTSDEMDHKLAHGVESLFEGFDRHEVNEILDIGRGSSLSA